MQGWGRARYEVAEFGQLLSKVLPSEISERCDKSFSGCAAPQWQMVVLEEPRNCDSFILLREKMINSVHEVDFSIHMGEDSQQKPRLTFEAQVAQKLWETPVPACFRVSLDEVQDDHWFDGHRILVTNLDPIKLGSEEVTLRRCAVGWVSFYPTPQLESTRFLDRCLEGEQAGAFYLLFESRNELTDPVRSARLCFLADHV